MVPSERRSSGRPSWLDPTTTMPEHHLRLELSGQLSIYRHRAFVMESPKSMRFKAVPPATLSTQTVHNISGGNMNPRRVQEMVNLKANPSVPCWSHHTLWHLLLAHDEQCFGHTNPNLKATWRLQFSPEWEFLAPSYKVHRPVPYDTLLRYWKRVTSLRQLWCYSLYEAFQNLQFHRNCILYPEFYEYIEENHPVFG